MFEWLLLCLIFTDGCISDITGAGLGLLAVYLRWVLDPPPQVQAVNLLKSAEEDAQTLSVYTLGLVLLTIVFLFAARRTILRMVVTCRGILFGQRERWKMLYVTFSLDVSVTYSVDVLSHGVKSRKAFRPHQDAICAVIGAAHTVSKRWLVEVKIRQMNNNGKGMYMCVGWSRCVGTGSVTWHQ